MNGDLIPLHMLPIGHHGKVKKLVAEGSSRRRMLDLGVIVGTDIECLCESPAGDPKAYQIRGAVIALRSEEASRIMVECI